MRRFIVKAGLVVAGGIVSVAVTTSSAHASCSWISGSPGYWSCSDAPNANVAPGVPTAAPVARATAAAQVSTVSNHISNTFSSTRAGGRQSAMLLESGISAGESALPFGLWMSGGFTSMNNAEAANEFTGTVGIATAGLDYSPSANAVFGLSVARETTSLETGFNAGNVNRTGFTFAPYAGYDFGQGTTIDAMVAFSTLHADVDRADGLGKGRYDGWRGMGAANAHHTLRLTDWALRGDLGYLYSQEAQGSYWESGSNTKIAAMDVNLAQGKIGGRGTYALSDTFEPFMQAHYSRDFVRNHISGITTDPRKPDENPNEITLGIGADWYPSDLASLGVEISRSVLREREHTTSVLANARVRF